MLEFFVRAPRARSNLRILYNFLQFIFRKSIDPLLKRRERKLGYLFFIGAPSIPSILLMKLAILGRLLPGGAIFTLKLYSAGEADLFSYIIHLLLDTIEIAVYRL